MHISCAADGSAADGWEGPRFNIAIMGEDHTGKSSFLARLYQNWAFYPRKTSDKEKTVTLAATNALFKLGVRGKYASFQTFELYSKKQYQLYKTLPKCDAYVIVYSLLSRRSVEQAQSAWEQIAYERGDTFPVVMVANKTDVSEPKTEAILGPMTPTRHHKVSAEQNSGTMEVLEDLILQFNSYVEASRPVKKRGRVLKNISNFFRGGKKSGTENLKCVKGGLS